MKTRVVPKDIATWRDSVPLKTVLEQISEEYGVHIGTAFRWWKAGRVALEVKWRSATRVEIWKHSIEPALAELRAWRKQSA